MKKVAYFLNGLGIGGTEKTAYLIAKYIDRKKFDITFFTYSDADMTRCAQIVDLCEILFIDRKNADFSVLSDFDIVHVFQSGYPERPRPNIDFNKKPNSKFIIHNVFGACDGNPSIDLDIYMSKWMMDNSYPVRGRKRIFIDNPVEEQVHYGSIRLPYKSGIILGRNGRNDPGTYCDVAVRATEILNREGHNISFLLLSPPANMLADLHKYNITYTIAKGFEDYYISLFYNTIDVYCESRADGHTGGNVIIEAMAHRKPVVTHRVYSRPDFTCYNAQCELVENYKTGIVTEPDPEKFAQGILTAHQNSGQFGLEGYQKYFRDSRPEVVAEKIEKAYMSLWS